MTQTLALPPSTFQALTGSAPRPGGDAAKSQEAEFNRLPGQIDSELKFGFYGTMDKRGMHSSTSPYSHGIDLLQFCTEVQGTGPGKHFVLDTSRAPWLNPALTPEQRSQVAKDLLDYVQTLKKLAVMNPAERTASEAHKHYEELLPKMTTAIRWQFLDQPKPSVITSPKESEHKDATPKIVLKDPIETRKEIVAPPKVEQQGTAIDFKQYTNPMNVLFDGSGDAALNLLHPNRSLVETLSKNPAVQADPEYQKLMAHQQWLRKVLEKEKGLWEGMDPSKLSDAEKNAHDNDKKTVRDAFSEVERSIVTLADKYKIEHQPLPEWVSDLNRDTPPEKKQEKPVEIQKVTPWLTALKKYGFDKEIEGYEATDKKGEKASPYARADDNLAAFTDPKILASLSRKQQNLIEDFGGLQQGALYAFKQRMESAIAAKTDALKAIEGQTGPDADKKRKEIDDRFNKARTAAIHDAPGDIHRASVDGYADRLAARVRTSQLSTLANLGLQYTVGGYFPLFLNVGLRNLRWLGDRLKSPTPPELMLNLDGYGLHTRTRDHLPWGPAKTVGFDRRLSTSPLSVPANDIDGQLFVAAYVDMIKHHGLLVNLTNKKQPILEMQKAGTKGSTFKIKMDGLTLVKGEDGTLPDESSTQQIYKYAVVGGALLDASEINKKVHLSDIRLSSDGGGIVQISMKKEGKVQTFAVDLSSSTWKDDLAKSLAS